MNLFNALNSRYFLFIVAILLVKSVSFACLETREVSSAGADHSYSECPEGDPHCGGCDEKRGSAFESALNSARNQMTSTCVGAGWDSLAEETEIVFAEIRPGSQCKVSVYAKCARVRTKK